MTAVPPVVEAEPAWCAPARDRADEANAARADERERIAAWLETRAALYPVDVYDPDCGCKDCLTGTVSRHVYGNAAQAIRAEEHAQP